MSTLNPKPKQHKALWIFIILAVIFIGPMIAAWALYFGNEPWLVSKTINHGQLVQPPLNFSQLKITALDNAKMDTSSFQNQWLIMYITPVSCDAVCQNNLYKMRQVWIALGKDQDRVQRLLVIIADNQPITLDKKMLDQYAGTFYAKASVTDIKQFFAPVSLRDIIPQQGVLCLVDPHANLMMVYKPDADPEGLLKDLTRLLNTSQIG